ncbi:hypothetical protein NLG97_g1124 [Lecanicillium saksenae]|uniref:Uncharacterized protein n=1 Tax=Lecanicillium saksenae TaxID=468837 RepID=A0ACC1R7Y4_9HYPO|nr:hypothetical protein NLG97_g1124 [Lecanicillium saksenae]
MRAFDFFQQVSILQLPGHLLSELWTTYILQLAQQNDAIFCATTALSSLHEWHAGGPKAQLGNLQVLAFRQYSRAVGFLTDVRQPPSEEAVLISCYLLTCFEALCGDHAAASSHIASGIHLSTQTGANAAAAAMPCPEIHHFKKLMRRQFSLLDLAAGFTALSWKPPTTSLAFGNRHASVTWAPLTTHLPVDLPQPSPFLFSSVENAIVALQNIIHDILTYKSLEKSLVHGRTMDSQLDEKREMLHTHISTWQRRLGQSFPITSYEFEFNQRIHFLLLISFKMIITIHDASCTNERAADKLLPVFEAIVTTARKLIRPSQSSHMVRRNFSMELGIVPALYLTGTKCRDQNTRKQALELLSSANRREWTWDSLDAAKELQRMMQLDE